MLLQLIAPTPRIMRYVRLLSSTLPLLVPVTMWRAIELAQTQVALGANAVGSVDLYAWFTPLTVFFVWTVADYFIGRDVTDIQPTTTIERWWYRALPLLCVPLQLSVLVWATRIFVEMPFSWLGQIGWLFSMGSVSGILAINVAHELIHKPSRLEQLGGGVLLASVGYGTFKVEHVLGHHTWVATARDASSAARGESLYTFVPRAIFHNVRNAFRIQAARFARRGMSAWTWRNELLIWSGLTLGFAGISFAIAGTMGLLFFIGQALIAVLHLEAINYIEHYGLQRQTEQDGAIEPVSIMHSWNSAYFLSNAYLFQLQRHSDHHAHAARPYWALRQQSAAPQLPGGYGAMILLALVPPLWRLTIDPRIPANTAQA
ncbi:MAG: alkane 1-monooxygenase [Burkholderiales bacterium]